MTEDDSNQPQIVITVRTALILGATFSALLVVLGVVGPILTMFGLSVSLWEVDLGKVIGVLGLLVAAILAAALGDRFRFRQEWAAITLGWLALGTACYYIYSVLKLRSDIPDDSADDPFSGFAQAFAPSLGWGVILVGIASATLIASSALAIQLRKALVVAAIGATLSIAIGIGTAAVNGDSDLATEQSTASRASAEQSSPPSPQRTTATTTEAPDIAPSTVAAVPGTNDNVYNVGPFRVEMLQGIATGPNQTTASEIRVTNTSSDFTGFGRPTVTYFQGDDILGSNRVTTERLSPGQSDTVWIDVESYKSVDGQWVNAQLITFWYGSNVGQSGTTAELEHAPFAEVIEPSVDTTPPTIVHGQHKVPIGGRL